jgi:hypothetical protein
MEGKAGRGEGSMEDRERQVDAEQLAALRRLRAAFGHVEVLAIHADDKANSEQPAYGQGELEEHDDRPAQDDPGGAHRGGGAAPPGGDDASVGGRQ